MRSDSSASPQTNWLFHLKYFMAPEISVIKSVQTKEVALDLYLNSFLTQYSQTLKKTSVFNYKNLHSSIFLKFRLLDCLFC